MDSGDDDSVLFKIGFESDPQSGSKLEALAKAVELVHNRMNQQIEATGAHYEAIAGRINKAFVGTSASQASAIPAPGTPPNRSGQSSGFPAIPNMADYQRFATGFEGVQAKLRASIEETQKRFLDSIGYIERRNGAAAGPKGNGNRNAVDRSSSLTAPPPDERWRVAETQLESDRVVEISRKEAVEIMQIDQKARREQELAADQAERANHARVLRELADKTHLQLPSDQHRKAFKPIRRDIEVTAQSLEGRSAASIGISEADLSAARARAMKYFADVKAAAEAEAEAETKAALASDEAKLQSHVATVGAKSRVSADEAKEQDARSERANSLRGFSKSVSSQLPTDQREAFKSLERDIEIAAKSLEGKTAQVIGISDQELAAAKARVAKYFDEVKKEAERAAKAGPKIEDFAKTITDADSPSSKRPSPNRPQRPPEPAAAQAGTTSTAVSQATVAQRSLNQAMREGLAIEQSLIEAYKQQTRASDQANQKTAHGRQQMITGAQQAAEGLGRLARGSVLLGLSQEEDMRKALKELAKIQAAIDIFSGAANLARGTAAALNGLQAAIVASSIARRAEAASAAIAANSSVAVARAIDAEAFSASRAATAHMVLARTRSGGGIISAAGQAAANVGVFGPRAGAAATAKMLGTGAGASRLAYAGVGGGIGTLVSAAGAAAAGLLFAAKSAYDCAKGFQTGGFMAGAAFDSVADKVGVAEANLLDSFGNLTGWFDLLGTAAAESADKQLKKLAADEAVKTKTEAHEESLRVIQIKGAAERNAIDRKSVIDARNFRLELIRDPKEKQKYNDLTNIKAQSELADAERNVNVRRKSADRFDFTKGEADSAKTLALLEAVNQAQERLNGTIEQRLELQKGIQQAERKTALDEIENIENLIQARNKEKKETGDKLKTAKERFGALSPIEQALTIRAQEKVQRGEPTTKKDVERLDRVGLEATDKTVSDIRMKSADKAKFDEHFGQNERMKIKLASEANAKDFDHLAANETIQKSGQTRDQLEQRANNQGPIKVDIVDRTKFEIQLNRDHDALLTTLADAIKASKEETNRQLKEQLQANEDAALHVERAGFRATSQQRNP